MGKIIDLEWNKICPMSEYIKWFESEEFQRNNYEKLFGCPGIYLWTEKVLGSSTECVNYVGKTTSSLIHRNMEHFLNFSGASYPIPGEYFENGIRLGNTISKDSEESKYSRSVYSNISRMVEAVHASFSYRENLIIYFAPVGDSSILSDVESDLLHQCWPLETKYSTRSASNSYFEFNHLGDLSPEKIEEMREQAKVLFLEAGLKRPYNDFGEYNSKLV